MNNDDQQQQSLIERIINWIIKMKTEDEERIIVEDRIRENRL